MTPKNHETDKAAWEAMLKEYNLTQEEAMEMMDHLNDAEKLEKGLRNKHLKKFERHTLMEEYELICFRKHQIERRAGFFDKKHNIFSTKDKKGGYNGRKKS